MEWLKREKHNLSKDNRNGGFDLQKIKVAVIYGGKSSEHEVSLKSAFGVIKAMSSDKYDILPIGITKEGRWVTGELGELMADGQSMRLGEEEFLLYPDGQNNKGLKIDVVFPVMHGTYAEDGAIQGLLELTGIPYVGCGIAASAIAFDKDLTKRMVSLLNLSQADYVAVEKYNYQAKLKEAAERIGFPCFVKPARQGSSVGIFKVNSEAELRSAVEQSFAYDSKVMIEEFISGREIEISVLGNEYPEVSLPGEIISAAEFYDYEAKYSSNSTRLNIPADVSGEQIADMQQRAKLIYQTLGCRGLARVDFFLTHKDNTFCFNEINTMPGFTPMSMYAKMWEAAGLKYADLLDKLIELALKKD